MKKAKIGIVGLGRLGKKYAENICFKTKNAELAAACSIVAEELDYAKNELGVEYVFEDYDQMLRLPNLDAIFIISSTSEHARQFIAALEAGHHVFCEKPLAITVEDCEAVEAVAASHPNQLAVVGFVRRCDPSYVYAKEKVDSGAIGIPFLVRSQTVDKDSVASFQIQSIAKSGGVFHDLNVHDIDVARWFLGAEIKTVYAVGGAYKHKEFAKANDADNVMTACVFDNGTMASISASRTASHGHDTYTEVVGTLGTLCIGRPAALNRVEIYDRHGARRECVEDFYDRFKDAFLIQAEDFINCIIESRKPKLTLRDATEATRVAVAFTTSFRKKMVIEIDGR